MKINWIHRFIVSALGIALIVIICSAPATANPSLATQIAEIVDAEVSFGLFSGNVLVAKDDEILYSTATGQASKCYQVPNTLSTRFNIGSIEKTFMATIVMQLAQEGKISLTDAISKYLPECPFSSADKIQIKHLLNHSSGLGDYRENPEYQTGADQFRTIDDVLPLVYQDQPTFQPGERSRYSNSGVLLIKAMIEKVTGLPLRQVLRQRILDPLGLDQTVQFAGGDVLERRATGYEYGESIGEFIRVLAEPSAYHGGGLYSTVTDLFKFDQAFYGNQLLNDQYKEIMTTPVGPEKAIAYGWFVIPYGGTTVVMHSGGTSGFAAEFRRYPEKGYTLIVLSNYSTAGFELTNAIEAVLLGLPYQLATESDLGYKLGMGFQQREQYVSAALYFDSNIQAGSAHMPSLYQAARTRIFGEFELEVAIERLRRYIELADENTQPSIASAWWRVAVAQQLLGRIETAIISCRKSIKLDPDFQQAHETLNELTDSSN